MELERGRFRSLASLILVVNVVGELQQKRTLAASRGFLAAARLSCKISALLIALVFTRGRYAAVQVYVRLGTYQSFVSACTLIWLCQVPCGVTVSGRDDDGRIYVADYNNRRVVRLSRNARYDACFVAAGTASTHLVQPQALDFAADGRLVVVDRTHVKIFDVGIRPRAAEEPDGTAEVPPTTLSSAADDAAKQTPSESKPARTGPKPAVPPRPKYLKELTFDGGQVKPAQTKAARCTASSASSTVTTTTSPARQTSTTVTPNTPTKSKSHLETEVW